MYKACFKETRKSREKVYRSLINDVSCYSGERSHLSGYSGDSDLGYFLGESDELDTNPNRYVVSSTS
jgi:hypothetical protein